jgi:hypothetical protein
VLPAAAITHVSAAPLLPTPPLLLLLLVQFYLPLQYAFVYQAIVYDLQASEQRACV